MGRRAHYNLGMGKVAANEDGPRTSRARGDLSKLRAERRRIVEQLIKLDSQIAQLNSSTSRASRAETRKLARAGAILAGQICKADDFSDWKR